MIFKITLNEASMDNRWDDSTVIHQTSTKPIKAGTMYMVRAIITSDYLKQKTEENFFFHTSADAKRFIETKNLRME